MRVPTKAILALGIVVLGAAPSWAEEAYYMIVFASQHADNQPKYSHTFAAFVKVADTAAKTPFLETVVISWLPATGSIAVGRLRPEMGKNFGLRETLDWAAQIQAAVYAWGPFRIKKELYESAQRQAKLLETGNVAYKAVDVTIRNIAVTNCIHAVSDLDIVKEQLATGTARGIEVSEMIVRFFRPWIIPSEAAPPWLLERLGLKGYQITYRPLD